MRVGLGDFLDETLQHCDILYRWTIPLNRLGQPAPSRPSQPDRAGDARGWRTNESTRKVDEIIGRIIQPLHDTRGEGDILLAC